MKKRKKTGLILMFILVASFTLLVACGKKNDVDETSKSEDNITTEDATGDEVNEVGSVDETVENSETDTQENDQTQETTEPQETTDVSKSEETTELPIYSINDDSLEKEDTVAVVPKDSEITAEFIVDEVVKSFEETGLEIGIESVVTEGDTVIVDFSSDKAPLVNVGSGVEATILDCIAQSLVDNLEGHNKVIYRVEGKAYESGHIMLDYDEVYLND